MSPQLDPWLTAALGHIPGELDAAANTVAPWSKSDLDWLLGGLPKQLKSFQEDRAPAAVSAIFRRHGLVDQAAMNRALKLAALLHADVAVLHRNKGGYTLPSDNSTVRLIRDGREVDEAGGTVQANDRVP